MKVKTLKEKIKKHKKKSVAIAIAAVAIIGFSVSSVEHNVPVAAATGNIDNLKWDLKLKPGMSEYSIEYIMHEMTHQKIETRDGKKWGAVPMCKDTIQQVYNYIWKSNYPEADKKEYLGILDRWKKGDFSSIVEDHNQIWNDENGNIGYAVSKATPQQEAQFVLVHFGLHIPTF